ncbi:MAG: hypothetical protein JXR68_07185 [Bacteroidales bacterium]|nr:hypothetical protein [Bacteroidales bacterium]
MKTVYQSKYLIMEFDADKSVLLTVWESASETLDDERIKKEIAKTAEITEKYSPKFKIADDRNRNFMYSIDIQKWVANKLKTAYDNAGVEKFAILLPDDLINQISTEQTIAEANDNKNRVQHFTSIEDAMKWFGF